MMTAPVTTWPPCPACGHNLADAEATLGPGVGAAHDPNGEAKVELLLTCFECEREFCAFVPVADLHDVMGATS